MDIERLAVTAVINSISKTDVLSPYINSGEKEPSWDGNIYIHEDKTKSKHNIKKVPVQVKGEKVERILQKRRVTYPVEIVDLDNWMNHGGTVLFVVQIDETGENTRILYSSRLPVLIRTIKQNSRGKKTISIPLRDFPNDNDQKVAVLLDFHNHMLKQTSFANANLPTIEQLQMEGVLENLSTCIVTYGSPEKRPSPESLFLQNDIYMYAKIKGSPVLLPLLGIVTNKHIESVQPASVKVKGREFYSQYRTHETVSDFSIMIGKSFTFHFRKDTSKASFDFKLRGNLSDYIRDSECMLAILEYREITIKGHTLYFDDIDASTAEKGKERLQYYKDVQKMLSILGVKEDLNCDNLSEQDQNNIRNFTKALVYGKDIFFPECKDNLLYGRFKIANLTILIWAQRDRKEDSFKLMSFFDKHRIVLFEDGDVNKEKPYHITHYALLGQKDFIVASNVNCERIIEDITENDTSTIVTEKLILFMLEMIKAYDVDKEKNKELLQVAEQYCSWLTENTENLDSIMTINRLQIVKRKRKFNGSEIQELMSIKSSNESFSIKCAVCILLDEKDEAQDYFDKLSDDEKKEFISFPIYNLSNIRMLTTE